MRKFIFVMSTIFAVTLAAVVGTRISPDAMAVIIGIVCGVLASIPTSVILVWVLRQKDRNLEMQAGQMRAAHYPPVVVVNGQGTNGAAMGMAPPVLTAGAPIGSRDFKVIGQENTESNADVLPSFWE